MSEPTDQSDKSAAEDASSHASSGKDVERPGGGRTGGETSVDEAMGAEEDPTP
jgi:hypothetical protein